MTQIIDSKNICILSANGDAKGYKTSTIHTEETTKQN
jgi:hypothetical protein